MHLFLIVISRFLNIKNGFKNGNIFQNLYLKYRNTPYLVPATNLKILYYF
jgi:hypothetical protein